MANYQQHSIFLYNLPPIRHAAFQRPRLYAQQRDYYPIYRHGVRFSHALHRTGCTSLCLCSERCWMGQPGGEQRVVQMCKLALKHGYRHFDTAAGYYNEEQVGLAVRESGIPRSDIYITSKLPNHHHHRVLDSFNETLEALNCDYIDLYLIHWPQATNADIVADDGGEADRVWGIKGKTLMPEESPTISDTWRQMEKLLQTGKVKSIGVSNFSIKTLTQLLSKCAVVPAVNQVELHPCLPQNELKAFCDAHRILLVGYSPLGRGPTFFEDATIGAVAERLGATPAQVLLSWVVQRGAAAVPKSENEGRIVDNISLVALPESDMAILDAFHKTPGMHRSLLTYHQGVSDVFGWTYEMIGWEFKEGGVVA